MQELQDAGTIQKLRGNAAYERIALPYTVTSPKKRRVKTKIDMEVIKQGYINTHGKMPRGVGVWAFCPSHCVGMPSELRNRFVHRGSFAAAQKAAVNHFKAQDGINYISVLS